MSKDFEETGAPAGALAAVERSQFMPAMSIELAVERYERVTEFVSRVLRRDVDYGVIPGTDKLTLLKPGAEKLTTFFGLATRFQLVERIEDWTGERTGGEPFFYYLYRCQLLRGDVVVAEADGSCNSRESKYRWRESQRLCPSCGQAAIIKGREEFGGGWLCFRKRGGCGAKFPDGDQTIESQQTGRVPNADIADQVNTIQKMSQKRSLIAATLLAVNASEFFTQDVEDFVGTAAAVRTAAGASGGEREVRRPARVVESGDAGAAVTAEAGAAGAAGAGGEGARLEEEILAACRALGRTEAQLAEWLGKKYGVEGVTALTAQDKREVLSFLKGRAANRPAA